jgi:hypothetical protein
MTAHVQGCTYIAVSNYILPTPSAGALTMHHCFAFCDKLTKMGPGGWTGQERQQRVCHLQQRWVVHGVGPHCEQTFAQKHLPP